METKKLTQDWKTNIAAIVYLVAAGYDLFMTGGLNANSVLLITSAWAFFSSKDA